MLCTSTISHNGGADARIRGIHPEKPALLVKAIATSPHISELQSLTKGLTGDG